MAAYFDDDTLSQSERNQLSTPSTPVLSCRDIRNSLKRNKLTNLERQKSIEVFQLPAELVAGRNWPNKSFHHVRWLVMILAASGLALTFIIRLSITVAIVKMVNQTALYIEEHPNATQEELEFVDEPGEFVWNNFIQSLIINSYYVGYALPQIYLSYLADRYGVNKPIVISQIISLVATALIPTFVYFGWEWVVLLRFALGLAGAANYPISVGMIDIWIPSYENTRALTLLQFVSITGIVLTPLYASYLCYYHWSMVFYVVCIIGAVWLVFWLVVVRNSPEECWLVSEHELKIILSERKYKPAAKKASPPWKSILTSRDFYVFLACWVFFDGTAIAFAGLLPTYMNMILKMDIQTIGTKKFFIEAAALLSIIWSGELVGFLTMKLKWTSRSARITTYVIAAVGALFTWSLPIIIGEGNFWMFFFNKVLQPATELVLIGTIIDTWAPLGLSGTMFSVYNTFGSGLIPIFGWSAGYMLDMTGGTSEAWHLLFLSFGLINLLGLFLYPLLKSNRQPAVDGRKTEKV